MQEYWQLNFERSERLINHGIGTEAFFKSIEQELPPVMSRAELSRATGGLISAKTLKRGRHAQRPCRARTGRVKDWLHPRLSHGVHSKKISTIMKNLR